MSENKEKKLTPLQTPERSDEGQFEKPPVVVVLGHVDHGKCVTAPTLIPLTDGRILTIEKIWEEYTRNRQPVHSQDKKGWISKPFKELKVFSFNGEKPVKARVSHLWKLEAPKKLVRVRLVSGDEITVTPEHPFFVFTPKGKIQQKTTDSLKENEFIIVPQRLTPYLKESEIKERFIQRLGSLRNLVVFLNPQKATLFLTKLRDTNKQELYRKGLFSTSPVQVISKKRMRARDFVKVGQYLGFSLEELYDMVDSIKNASEKWRVGKRSHRINLPKIAKDLKKLGYITGCLAGDGETSNGRFHNSNPEIQKSFCKYLKEVSGLSTKIIKTKTGFKIENRGWKTLTRFLTDIMDFPRWKKSKKIKFPQLFSASLFIQGFIAGLFDTDGYVSPFNYWAEFSSKSKDLMKEISIFLLQFGIHSSIHKIKKKGPNFKRKRTYWNLRIANRPYLERFLNAFPIKHQEKKKRLKEVITKTSVSRIFDLTPISGKNLYSFYINEHSFPYFSQYRKYKNLSRYFLKRLLHWKDKISLPKIFLQPSLKQLINPGEISCVKVREKEVVRNKSKFVYDLTVPKYHNFVADRMFVHNTAILDFIRKTNVVSKESGGITQHIGAYEVEVPEEPKSRASETSRGIPHQVANEGSRPEKSGIPRQALDDFAAGGHKITFIDTPGHEAFSAMRSRGAKVADIAILVVAATEGVKTQTKEAISFIKKAGIPMIVALNKIDKPQSEPERVKNELAKHGVLVESLGGKVPSVKTSAKTGEGIKELLETILLVAEMEELKADISGRAEGTVIESYLDSKKGPIATLILENGILKENDIIGTSSTFGKVKSLTNFQGKPIQKAYPSQPISVLGFEKPPLVGEKFRVYNSPEEARSALEKKEEMARVVEVKEGQKVLNIILKTDVLGSSEAIEGVLKNVPQEKVMLRILKNEVGDINVSDIRLAESGKAVIFGFRVKIAENAKRYAQQKGIRWKIFEVIYELVQEVRRSMLTTLEPEVEKVDLGKVKILALFKKGKEGQVIGGKVIKGEIERGAKVEILRDEEIVGKGKIKGLQQEKKDIREVSKGKECGILFQGEGEIKEGDILRVFREERKRGEL